MKSSFSRNQNMSTTHCAIENCRTTILNKPPGVSFHSCPTSSEMRKQWLKLLKNKCSTLDWYKSQICSKHFESKYLDSQRRLKDNAIPTIFASSATKQVKQSKYSKDDSLQSSHSKTNRALTQDAGRTGFHTRSLWNQSTNSPPRHLIEQPRSKVDRLLKKLTQAELTADIKLSINKLNEPSDLDSYVNDDLKCRYDAPKEAQLWLVIKKQDHLNNRLMELVVQTKKHVEILQNNSEQSKNAKRENEQTIESLKYVVKCLQEKHATLEEQIEILTAVESR